MAGIQSASQLAQQKAQTEQPQQVKQGASKFDNLMADKAQTAGPTGQVDGAQRAQMAQKASQVDVANKVDGVGKLDKAALNKVDTRTTAKGALPVQANAESHSTKVMKGMLSSLEAGQANLDKLISSATSGKQFSNGELLSLQAGMYKYSQELDLTSKVVEKATSGLKDTLKTQV